MKKMIYTSILLLTTTVPILTSCTLLSNKSSIKTHTYDEVIDYHISFKNLLKMEDFEYFAYIYSPRCLHCESIKYEVIEYALDDYKPMYFIVFDETIPLIYDISISLNQNTLSNVGILGTPAMILVVNGYVKINISGGDVILSLLDAYK